MATVLLLLISTIFIGLGLPDSVFGPAWPAIYVDFGVSVSYANLVTMPIYLGTVIASFFAAKLINKFGTGNVAFVSTLVSTLAVLGFSLAPSVWWMVLLSLPLGMGAGAIDSALNNYVAVHYSSSAMSFMHCFYGVGVSLSPFLMSFALDLNNDWRLGFRIVFLTLAVITVLSFIALPLWKKVATRDKEEDDFTPVTLSFRQIYKTPAVKLSWLLFFSTCALEFTCGIWGATFLVGEGLTEANSARFITLYYLGITSGRFVSGLIGKKLKPQTIVYLGYTLVGIAIVTMLLPIPSTIKGVSLFFIGFGNGPTFPNMISLTPRYFGKDVSQSIIATQMVTCNLGILFIPPIFGFVADFISVSLFPAFLGMFALLMIVSTLLYHKKAKSLALLSKEF